MLLSRRCPVPERYMIRKLLTDRGLRALHPAPPGKRLITWDAAVPGLGVRSTDKGHHSFVLVVRYPGSLHPTPKSLGDVGAISLEQARDKARDHLALIDKGIDPKAEAERKRQAELRKQQHTFESVAEAFITRHTARLRTGNDIARDLRREFVSRWGKRPISEIDRFDVLSIIELKVDAGSRHQARNLLAHIRKLFAWAISRGVYGLENSPCANIKPADLVGPPAIRDRILGAVELAAFWTATGAIPPPFGPLFRCLLLTGARRDEIASARWSEIDFEQKLFTLSADRTKAGSRHVVPLTDTVIEIFRSLPRLGECCFTSSGSRPVSGFSKAKKATELLMRKELGAEPVAWRLHDLRRTMRTGLSALGVQDRVAELTIGHRVQGLHRVYDLHRYIEERFDALKRWEIQLLGIVEPRPANVVPFDKAAT